LYYDKKKVPKMPKLTKVPKVMVSLAQRRRSRSAGAPAACAPRVAPSILIKWAEFLNFSHFRSLPTLVTYFCDINRGYAATLRGSFWQQYKPDWKDF
jgi:hypothetical protein